MRDYFTLFFHFLNLSFSSISYSQNAPLPITRSLSHTNNTCTCFQNPNSEIRSLSRKFWFFSTSSPPPNAIDYPYYLINVELEKNKIKNPIHYFEYNNNFHIYNDTTLNSLNRNLKYYTRYPESFERRKATNPKEFHEQYNISIKHNYEINEIIKDRFRDLYRLCYLAGHNNPLTLYDHGFLAFTEGNPEEAMDCAEKYIKILKENNLEDQIQPSEMLLLGESYLELNEYSKAIYILSELIQKDPTNKDAYLNRSFAYFETGSFEEALLDFNLSNKEKSLPPAKKSAPFEFTEALMINLYEGSKEAIVEFVPSLCETACGLDSTLWIGVQSPIESSKNFADACYEMGECVIEYCKTVDGDKIDGYIDEMKIFHEHLDNLSEKEKGELIGYTVGKYGVDFFAGAVAIKGVKAFRNLKTANNICNLETMAVSASNKEAIIASSLQHTADKKNYIKNVKYNFDAHNKHILGHNDFIKTGSIWQHPDPEELLRRFGGTGYGTRSKLGLPGYRESIDFKEHIGIWKNKNGTLQLPTTRGTIHYGNKGAHIVPSDPNPIIRNK